MKKLLSAALCILLLFSFLACGSSGKEAAPAMKEENTPAPDAVETVEEPAEPSANGSEPAEEVVEESIPLLETETVEVLPSVILIDLSRDTVFTREDDYVLSGLYGDILTDASLNQGWCYYYGEGTDAVIPSKNWAPAPGMYTSCELYYNLENLKDGEEQNFKDRFSGFVVFNTDPRTDGEYQTAADFLAALQDKCESDSAAELISVCYMQTNPGQLDSDGYLVSSLDASPLGKNVYAQQRLLIDIPVEFLRSWENGSEEMWAVLCYDEDAVFLVNLRTVLVDEYA